MAFDGLSLLLLVVAGFLAGFINTIAGGGSMLTVPALMLWGLPADLANGTNRIAVFMQSAVAVKQFHGYGKLDGSQLKAILLPTASGAILGSMGMSLLPVEMVKPLLLGTMVAVALVMVVVPDFVAQRGSQAYRLNGHPVAWGALFITSLYGGAIQGGVGFLLIATFTGLLRYDLVQTNALKMLCTGVFGLLSLAIYWWQGLVQWVPGLIVAMATMVGAALSVRFAVKADQKWLKRILLLVVIAACITAFQQ